MTPPSIFRHTIHRHLITVRFILGITFLLTTVVPLGGCSGIGSHGDRLLDDLDNAVDTRLDCQHQRYMMLAELERQAGDARSVEERYDLLHRLTEESLNFNADSALATSHRLSMLAERSGDRDLQARAALSRANVLGHLGMYGEAEKMLDSISMLPLSRTERDYSIFIRRTLYEYMADNASEPELKARYAGLTAAYRDSVGRLNETGGFYDVLWRCDISNAKGAPGEGARMMEEYIATHQTTARDKALAYYHLAESYRLLGQTARQRDALALSAINDMQTGVREYISLRKLALMLYLEGDYDRAYRYLNVCMEDAAAGHSRLRLMEAGELYPVVNGVFIDTIERQRHRLRVGFWAMSCLTLLLLVTAYLIYRQKRTTESARVALSDANARLNDVNGQLERSNRSLTQANAEIRENAMLKEEFIASYMEQCTAYISKLDQYQMALQRIVATRRYDELGKALRTLPSAESEAKAFYDSFDETFLRLFPNFISDFNALLRPDAQIEPRQPGRLTPELRIFALIRLGITDSKDIARFLRYTPATVHTYRTRIRNRAKGDRDELEALTMKIGIA